jgi:hypothetical protein
MSISETDGLLIQFFLPIIHVELDNQMNMLRYHGSPHSSTDAIRATAPDAELTPYFQGDTAQILVGEHNHQTFPSHPTVGRKGLQRRETPNKVELPH